MKADPAPARDPRLAAIRETLHPTRHGYEPEILDLDDARWLLARVEALEQREQTLGVAIFAALDVVREHIGSFTNWPAPLQEAFADAIIDPTPPSEADIARTRELADRFGWE